MTIDTFPIASSDLVSTRLAILAYLAIDSAGAPELGEAIKRGRTQTWETLTALEAKGFVRTHRRVWAITPEGVNELARLYSHLATSIKEARDKQQRAAIVRRLGRSEA